MTEILENCCGSKEKLIKATYGLIASKGFESTGISEILEKAGVTKSNFYYHFKSKEELCLTVLDHMENYFFENMVNPSLLNVTLAPKERLRKYLDSTVARMATNCCNCGCPFVNLGNETSDFYPAFRNKISQVNTRHLQAIQRCIHDGVQSGDFRQNLDPAAMAKFILAEVNGSVVLAKIFKTTDVLNENNESLLAILCN